MSENRNNGIDFEDNHADNNPSKDSSFTHYPLVSRERTSRGENSRIEVPQETPNYTIVDENSSLEEVRRSDLEVIDLHLKMMMMNCKNINSIDEYCKLALTSMKLIKDRRDALGLPTRAEEKPKGSSFLDPLTYSKN